MPEYRTIDKAFDSIKARDPDTCLTRGALRRLVRSGKVPSVRIGTKYLLDVERLEQVLQGDKIPAPGGAPVLGVHRIAG